MKKSELKSLIREIVEEISTSDTPWTDSFAQEGWSGDAVCVSDSDTRNLELASKKLLNAAKHVVLTGEGLTELDHEIDEYEKFIKTPYSY